LAEILEMLVVHLILAEVVHDDADELEQKSDKVEGNN